MEAVTSWVDLSEQDIPVHLENFVYYLRMYQALYSVGNRTKIKKPDFYLWISTSNVRLPVIKREV